MSARPRLEVVVEHRWHPVPGGTGRAADATIAALAAAARYDVVGRAARHTATTEDLPTRHSRLPRPLLYEAWLRLGRPVEGGDADVVWAPGMVAPPTAGTPLVVTVHDLDFLHHPDRLSGRGRRFFPLAWQRARERAARIVTPSAAVAEAVIAEGVEAGRVSVVPWGVSLAPPAAGEVDVVLERYGLRRPYVLWVGTLEPRKNLAGLLAAMRDVDAPLVIVGPGGWGDTEVPARLGERVIRTGPVSDAELVALYAGATVFALPSHHEGFGLPVLEAMACGAPVVTARGGATEEVAGGAAVLVDPADPGSIADGIAGLLEQSDRREELAAAGRRRAASFTWERTAAGYVDVFDEVR